LYIAVEIASLYSLYAKIVLKGERNLPLYRVRFLAERSRAHTRTERSLIVNPEIYGRAVRQREHHQRRNALGRSARALLAHRALNISILPCSKQDETARRREKRGMTVARVNFDRSNIAVAE
jgi:hypothetical protein